MSSRTTLRIVSLTLALALVLAPASLVTASPWSLDAAAVEHVDDGGVFGWLGGWLHTLLGDSGTSVAQVGAAKTTTGSEVVPAPPIDPTSDGDSIQEEGDRGPSVQVDG